VSAYHQKKYEKFIPWVKAIAATAKPPGKQVGALVLGPDMEVRSTGYNGMPRKVVDTPSPRFEKPERWFWMAHAEENAVANAARIGVSMKGCTMIVTTLFPCTTCARLIIQSGITTVLSLQIPEAQQNPKWVEEATRSRVMFEEAGVEVVHLNDPAIDCQFD
jgi:dCMP deaminase